MQSDSVALLMPECGSGATLWVRRSSGEFAFQRVDARVASASRMVANWGRDTTPAMRGERAPVSA